MDWVRARSDTQIEQRINEIVDATARLFEESRYEDITFSMIAKEANFTRSNLYRYFQTREDIFLELLKHDIVGWRKDMLETLVYMPTSPHDIAESLVELILRHERMVKLFTILFTLLEPNASIEALKAFKQKITEEIGTVAQFLSTILPFPSIDATSDFLTTQSYLAMGTYPMMNLSPKQKEAMQAIGMDTSPEYYKQKLVHGIEILLKGLTVSTS